MDCSLTDRDSFGFTKVLHLELSNELGMALHLKLFERKLLNAGSH